MKKSANAGFAWNHSKSRDEARSIPDEFTVQTWTDLTPNSEFEESSSCSSSSSRIPIVSRSD